MAAYLNLELLAMRWLWLEKKCHYILEERCLRYWAGQPDVIGITEGRFLIEIEIKRSVSDFKRDAQKIHRKERQKFLPQQPRQLYYLMPKAVADKIAVPEWAGLMVPNEDAYALTVVRKSPVNLESKKLSLKECVRATRCMTNHMMCLQDALESRSNQFKHGHESFYLRDPKIQNYEI